MTDAELDALDRLCQRNDGDYTDILLSGVPHTISFKEDFVALQAMRNALPQLVAEVRRAKERENELSDAVRGLLHIIRADQLVPESVSYMRMAAKAVGMEVE